MPNVGFEYTFNERSIIAQAMVISKEGVNFTEEDLKNIIKSITKYTDSRSNVDTTPKEFTGEIHQNTLLENEELRFYKYIPEETYSKYIAKGKFLLGSLRLYREIEKTDSRDEKEGFSNLLISACNRDIFVPVISGFNYYVLCGTNKSEYSKEMSNKFGSIMISIDNVKSFAESIKKAIGAKRWFVRRIDYSDFKAYRTNKTLNSLPKKGFDMNEELFNCLLKSSTTPSIFVKPTRFSGENELRLVFEMPRNVKKQLKLHNQGLLQYIKKNI